MSNIVYALLPTEVLVVNPASRPRKWKRVEFSPAEIRQAVETGATLAKKNQSVQLGRAGRELLHLDNIIYHPTCLIKLSSWVLTMDRLIPP